MKHARGCLKIVESARRNVREISAAEVKAKLDRGDRFEFVDVREDDEWRAGRASGARHIGRGVLERDVETLVPECDAEIVLYCGGGYRSALAADNLQKMGYTNVISMDGGWRAWVQAGMDLER